MKFCLTFSILVWAYSAKAQTTRDTNSSSPTISIDIIGQRKNLLKRYSDSVANYTGGCLPSFMLDACLDWNAYLWEDLHSPVSIRWEILKEVTNKKALSLMMLSHKKQLKKHCLRKEDNVYPYLKVPMIEKSFYVLLKKRYAELIKR